MEQVSYIHVDSRSRDTTLYPFSNAYTVFLNKPIMNVTRVDLVSAIVTNPSASNAYIWLDITELRTPFTYAGSKLSLTNTGTFSLSTVAITGTTLLKSTTLAGQANQTYTSVSDTVNGTGTGVKFTVTRNASGAVSAVTPNSSLSPGSGYAVGDTITLGGGSVGGVSPTDNIIFTVATLVSGVVATIGPVLTSTTILPQANQTYTGVASTDSGAGVNATFTVTRNAAGAVSSVTIAAGGSGYAVNDTVTIAGTLVGGSGAGDNITFKVTSIYTNGVATISSILASTTVPGAANGSYTNVPTVLNTTGSGAKYTVTRNAAGAILSIVPVAQTGLSYSNGDTVTILGTSVGGSSPADNVIFTITTAIAPVQVQRNQPSSLTPATSFAVVPMTVAQNFQQFFRETGDYAWSVTYPSRLDSIERLTIRWLDYTGSVVTFGTGGSTTYDFNSFVLRVYTRVVPVAPERPFSLPPPVSEGLFDLKDKPKIYIGALMTLIVGLVMIMLLKRK